MLSKGASAIIGITALLLMTRYLGTEQYGTLTWTIAFLGIFNSIADLGFGSAHTKRVSEGCEFNACISTFAYVKGLLTLAMVVVVLLSVGMWSVLSEHPLSGSAINIILILLVYQALSGLTSIATASFDARTQTAKSQLISLCDPLVKLPFLIFVLTNGMGTTSVSLAYLAGGIAAISVATFQISREHIVWQKPTLIHTYAIWAVPILFVTISDAITTQLPATMIGSFWSKSDVAYYTVSVSLLSYIGLLGSSVMVLLFPTFSKLAHEGKLTEIIHAAKEGERYLSLIGLPILITVIVFPGQIAGIMFGDAFEPAGKVLPFLAASTYIALLNLTVSAQVLGMNRVDLYLKWTVALLIVSVTLLVVLVPSSVLGIHTFGLSYRGAAIASIISAFVGYGIARWLAFILTKAKPNLSILKHVVAAGAMAFIMFYASSVFPVNHLYEALAYLLISVGGFFSILYFLREFTARDLHFILDTLSIPKLGQYIRAELSPKKKERL
jgi:O-antigen/teichoic acid export membrane protein